MFIVAVLSALGCAASSAIVPADSTGDATWPYQTFKSVNFTPPYLHITHHTQPSEGYLFLAPDGATEFQLGPLIMDMYGELIWNGPSEHAFNFGAQKYCGQDVLVWWNGTLYPEPIGRGNGVVYMLNHRYEQIHEVTLVGDFREQIPGAVFPSNVDLHEVYVTDNGTMLVTANNVTQRDLSSVGGPTDGWVVDSQMYEIDVATNQVLFSWKSLDHLDQLPFSASLYPLGSEGFTGENQTVAWAYFHINALCPFEDAYLISSRYMCSAMAIAPDGHVKWRVQGRDGGDFTLGNGTDFCYQHDVRILPERPVSAASNVTLHMHDNHNCPIDNGSVPSSGKSLLLDVERKTVTLKHQYINESGPIYSTALGSYQPLADGNVFIGHGWIPILEEYTHAGEILTTIQFGVAAERPEGGYLSPLKPTLSYRAFKQHWVGCPAAPPDIAAERGNVGVTVYASWNGATEVEAWEVYGGNSTQLARLAAVKRSGFETAVEIPLVNFVQVRAIARKGRGGMEACAAGGVASEVLAVGS